MALFTAVNFLSVRRLANTNSVATWWKVGDPGADDRRAGDRRACTSGNFSAADGFAPSGAGGVLAAVSTSGIVFALLGFEQADQLAGESANPKRDIPRAVIGAIVIGAMIYILLQVVFIAALPASQIGGTWADVPVHDVQRPVRAARLARRRRLAGDDPLHRRRHLAGRHRPDLHDRRVARLLRAQPQRLRPGGLRADRRAAACRGRACSPRSWSAASASCRSRAGGRWSG